MTASGHRGRDLRLPRSPEPGPLPVTGIVESVLRGVHGRAGPQRSEVGAQVEQRCQPSWPSIVCRSYCPRCIEPSGLGGAGVSRTVTTLLQTELADQKPPANCPSDPPPPRATFSTAPILIIHTRPRTGLSPGVRRNPPGRSCLPSTPLRSPAASPPPGSRRPSRTARTSA